MVNLGRLFCCSSDESAPTPKQNNPPPQRKALAPQAKVQSGNPPSDRAKTPVVPRKNDVRRTGAANVPLDYVNPGETPEEVMIKGRRHSVSVNYQGYVPKNDTDDGLTSTNHTHPFRNSMRNSTILQRVDNNNDDRQDENAQVGEVFVPTSENMDQSSAADYGHENLLPPQTPDIAGRKCLVLDLDETLVHSSFTEIWNADFVIAVDVEGTVHDVYVAKRPGVDEFIKRVSELYEVVVFTASVSKYGDPLLDRLDPNNYVHHRLFRESCLQVEGSYIKNLAWLGRNLHDVVIIDNSPSAYSLQPFNAVPVSSWFSDVHDNELLDMVPILEDLAAKNVTDVSKHLQYQW